MTAGSPGTLANTFVSLYVLRHSLNCTLPATVMYWGEVPTDVPSQETVAFMQEHIANLTFLDASGIQWPEWQPRLVPDAEGWRQKDGWRFKAFVLWAAPYKQVLFLDSDATAAIDPTVLFEDANYRKRGSMFWPELWCGDAELFRALHMPSIGSERQTESGMFLVDRQRHWLMVEWALWLNMKDDITYKLAYGDKDTFRAAFHLAGTLESFYQVQYPLGLMLEQRADGWLNRGYLQPHPNGSSMFVHRVAAAKLDPGQDDPKPITHVTVPSCHYFSKCGFNAGVIGIDHFQDSVFDSSSTQGCTFSMHSLYNASLACGGYDYVAAKGTDPLPVFQIAEDGHVGRALAAASSAFRFLREAKHARGSSSRLFELPAV